jgi:hypothetical protein
MCYSESSFIHWDEIHSTSNQNQSGVDFSSSQNSVLPRDQSHGRKYSSFAAFRGALSSHTFAVQIVPNIFLEVSPIQNQFCPAFCQTVRVFCMFCYCLIWRNRLETFSFIGNMFPWVELVLRKISSEFMGTLTLVILLSACADCIYVTETKYISDMLCGKEPVRRLVVCKIKDLIERDWSFKIITL